MGILKIITPMLCFVDFFFKLNTDSSVWFIYYDKGVLIFSISVLGNSSIWNKMAIIRSALDLQLYLYDQLTYIRQLASTTSTETRQWRSFMLFSIYRRTVSPLTTWNKSVRHNNSSDSKLAIIVEHFPLWQHETSRSLTTIQVIQS